MSDSYCYPDWVIPLRRSVFISGFECRDCGSQFLLGLTVESPNQSGWRKITHDKGCNYQSVGTGSDS